MDPELVVPDGGRGWAVVAGTAVINEHVLSKLDLENTVIRRGYAVTNDKSVRGPLSEFIMDFLKTFNQSLLSMFGLIFGAKLESLAGTTGVATVMSVNCAVSNFSGFLTSPLSKYLTTRFITQCSVVLVATGLIISAYIENYGVIIAGYGVLSGLGLGLISSNSFLIVNSYFDKYKSFAVAFAMAGTSLGQMGLPPLVAYLLKVHGYTTTLIVLACLSLIGVFGAMTYDPVSNHLVRKDQLDAKNGWISKLSSRLSMVKKRILGAENEADLENLTIRPETKRRNVDSRRNSDSDTDVVVFNKHATNSIKNGLEQSVEICENNSQELQDDADKEAAEKIVIMRPSSAIDGASDGGASTATCCQRFVRLFDLTILLDPKFLHIMIGLSLAYTTSTSFSAFFPLFLTEDLNMSEIQASTCMSTLSFMDLLGRFIAPLLSRYLNASHRMTFLIACYMLAISRSVLVMQTDYRMVLLLSAMCGLARAATVINQNLVIAEYSKEAHVSAAIGLNMVSKGIFIFSISILLGEFKDSAHNNYGTCIHVLDVISLGVAISWSLELILSRIVRQCHRNNKA